MQITEFSLTLNEHSRPLKDFAYYYTRNNDDANDLYQDTLLKAVKHIKTFKDGTNLRAWLFTIMRNTFFNNFRKERQTTAIFVKCDDLASINLLKDSSTNQAENKFVSGDINKALARLPQACSVPFIRYFEGYKYHEIAEELQIPLGTVKTRIHMARGILKKILKAYAVKETSANWKAAHPI